MELHQKLTIIGVILLVITFIIQIQHEQDFVVLLNQL